MKKVLALLLVGLVAVVFALSLSGCGSKEEVMEDITIEPEVVDDLEGVVDGDIALDDVSEDAIYIDILSKVFADINFEYDQYRVLDRDIPTLEGIAAWMRETPDANILIEGHCDERGTNEYNMALGEQRALAARRYLVGLGIDSGRLTTISYGEERPAALGSTEAAWS
ncbi:MAG: OmpA family protein, partial [Candidatus Eisenbacteria bacterium]|nr:OmpA family protein [Candidatus Eisenbacteria bacterium]